MKRAGPLVFPIRFGGCHAGRASQARRFRSRLDAGGRRTRATQAMRFDAAGRRIEVEALHGAPL